jgi:hypothetical protein
VVIYFSLYLSNIYQKISNQNRITLNLFVLFVLVFRDGGLCYAAQLVLNT